MKINRKCFKILLFTLNSLLFTIFAGCERGYHTSVEFVGKVYYGLETSDGRINVLGPLQNATVVAVGYSGSATTDSTGKYDLTVKAVRTFNGPPLSESYTLEASGTSAPQVYPQGDYVSEQIIVSGRPGDIIPVRDFLLFEHHMVTQ